MPNVHNTFVLERSYPASPDRVFAAFSDPAQKRRWFAEGLSHVVEEFTMDFRPGGVERARYRFAGGPFDGVELSSEGSYHDIVAGQRIVSASTMSMGGRHISVALVTIEFVPNADGGTDLICTHQAVFFEGSDGPQMREAGWRTLFDQLATELLNA